MIRLLTLTLAASMLVACVEKKPEMDIWTAAATGNRAVIVQHLAAGTHIDARDPAGGSSALVVAALYGRVECARLLIERGASVDARNNDRATALHVAAFFCHPEVCDLLLRHGAERDARNRYGQTPLETVAGAWSGELEGVYTMVAALWKLELDLQRIRATRPQVAELLRRRAGGQA